MQHDFQTNSLVSKIFLIAQKLEYQSNLFGFWTKNSICVFNFVYVGISFLKIIRVQSTPIFEI